jgi:hypothetical protein
MEGVKEGEDWSRSQPIKVGLVWMRKFHCRCELVG